jgi:hypothetical protein
VLIGIAFAGGVGLLLGVFFRVPAVLAASGLLVAASAIAGPVVGGWWASAALLVSTLISLQAGYLAGLVLGCAYAHASAGRRGSVHATLPATAVADRTALTTTEAAELMG